MSIYCLVEREKSKLKNNIIWVLGRYLNKVWLVIYQKDSCREYEHVSLQFD